MTTAGNTGNEPPIFEYPQPTKLPRTGTKGRRIIDACIVEMEALGWVAGDLTVRGKITSVRFVFYRLESNGVVPKQYVNADGKRKSRQPHQDVSDALTTLRYQGVFPLDSIIDETVSSEDYRGEPSFLDGIYGAVLKVRINPWPSVPELWVESRSLAGVLRGLAYRYRIPLVPLTGQASVGLLAEVAKRIAKDPPERVWYLGDYDLSGGHIESSAIERVEAFAGVELSVERLAITRHQIDTLNLPIVDKYDKRTRRYAPAVEAEALGQPLIESIVAANIREYWTEKVTRWPTLKSIQEFEDVAQDKLFDHLDQLDGTEYE